MINCYVVYAVIPLFGQSGSWNLSCRRLLFFYLMCETKLSYLIYQLLYNQYSTSLKQSWWVFALALFLGLIFLKIPSNSTGSLNILLSIKRYWDHPLQIWANPQSYCDPVYCTEELVLCNRLMRSPENPIPQLCNNMRYLGSPNIWSFAHVLVTVIARC